MVIFLFPVMALIQCFWVVLANQKLDSGSPQPSEQAIN